MITIRKLATLAPGTRRRKIVRLLEGWERDPDPALAAFLRDLARLVETDVELPDRVRVAARTLAGTADRDLPVRAVNGLRHALASYVGDGAADWDLRAPAGLPASARDRTSPLDGVCIYLESLRSPFNVGSIIRSAAAFGVSGVVLSPDCPPADHPRLLRSAMGSTGLVRVERGSLDDAIAGTADAARATAAVAAGGADQPAARVVALELGGHPVASYEFPDRGVLVVGSEELGVSPGLLERADARVAIPMAGGKASLNVGVACGIALAFWSASHT